MRLMPNINCAVSAGTLVLSADPETPLELVDLVTVLSSYVGCCIRVDEAHFNAASSISGCGPAFVSLLNHKMIYDLLLFSDCFNN